VEVGAEALPFGDNTFDTVIATLVFCTIPNPAKALEEIRRVSKPGANLVFFEHVRMEQPSLGELQDILNPFWENFGDGCQLNRDTLGTIRQAGIEVVHVESLYKKLFLSIKGLNIK
jgi:SAM-dependent methyltransferase